MDERANLIYDLREYVCRNRRAYELITAFATVELTKDYKLCMPNYIEGIQMNVLNVHIFEDVFYIYLLFRYRQEHILYITISRTNFAHIIVRLRAQAHSHNMHKYV